MAERADLQGCSVKNTAIACYDAAMIILSHITALAYMRFVGPHAVAAMKRVKAGRMVASLSSASEAYERYDSFASFQGFPIRRPHLLCSTSSRKKNTPSVRFHAASHLKLTTLIQIERDVFMSTPEAVFLQLAQTSDLIDAIQLGYELCGMYTYPYQTERHFADRTSFTSCHAIEKLIDKQNNTPGVAAARQAISYVVDGSASPMETACAMLLGLPYKMGGLNFPAFTMNQKISIPAKLRLEIGRSQCFCDLAWSNQKVAFEYDSNQHHVGAERIAQDSSRRNALLRMGYKVVTLTGNQMGDAREFLRVAKTLGELLGHRIQPRCSSFDDRFFALRRAVLLDQAAIFQQNH